MVLPCNGFVRQIRRGSLVRSELPLQLVPVPHSIRSNSIRVVQHGRSAVLGLVTHLRLDGRASTYDPIHRLVNDHFNIHFLPTSPLIEPK